MFTSGKFKRLRNHSEAPLSLPEAGAQGDKLASRVAWLTWLWPSIIILSAISVGLVTFVLPDTVVRPALAMWFLFVCPGMTVVRFFRFAETVIEWMLALALSFAIDAFVSGILLYAGWWSPVHILSILIGFCLISAIMQLVIIRPGAAAIKLKRTL